MTKKTLTSSDIAKYCGIAPRTAAQWINEGRIKAYRTPGNHFRVKIDDFIEFLRKYNMPLPQEFETQAQPEKKQRILIVDDDKNMAEAIKRLLKLHFDYELESAFDGFDAGQKVMAFKPDLMILDMKMPAMDGLEVARIIKETPETAHIHIIAISAYFNDETKEKMLSLGAKLCMDKPFDQKLMIKTVKALLH